MLTPGSFRSGTLVTRLRSLIAEHADEEGSLGEFLMEELYSFVGESWEQEDDISLLSLRCSATRSRTSLELR